MVCAFTGNRDLDEEPAGGHAGAGAGGAADRFDITSPPRTSGGRPARSLTFGAGVHYCLGANLARAEMQEALALLARSVRDLELDGEPVFEGVTGIYGLTELPIRFTLA